MASDDITPWTWIQAVMETVGNMPWWLETAVDRTPLVTHGYPHGWLDECDCANNAHGQALVTAGAVFYAGDTFPAPARVPVRLSTEGEWATNLIVDYARCRPVVNERGQGPSVEARWEFADGLYRDGQEIWRALRCAVREWRETGPGFAVLTSWGPITRDIGQCAGFTYTLTAKVKVCDDCVTE